MHGVSAVEDLPGALDRATAGTMSGRQEDMMTWWQLLIVWALIILVVVLSVRSR